MIFGVLMTLLAAAVSYLAGSIPTGYLIVKAVNGEDIRKIGSGNIGATNVKRATGMGWFLFVLFFDALKGFAPVLIFKILYGDIYPPMPVIAGACAILGHTFTLFLKFKGGKGVATALGVFIALAPFSVGTSLLVFVVLLLFFRYISLGSIVGAALLPVFVFIYAESGYMGMVLILSLVGAAFIIYKHKDNIKRLMDGTENRFEFGKKTEKSETQKKTGKGKK